MFDISWTEFLLIGVVALIVIGPKELPAVMRTLGQWTRKVRSMANDFQHQFQEAMREAEMADLKKQVDDMARDVRDLDPLKGVRDDIEGVGKDVQSALASTPEANRAVTEAAPEPPPAVPAADAAVPVPLEAPNAKADLESASLGAGAESSTAPSADKSAQADGTGRTG